MEIRDLSFKINVEDSLIKGYYDFYEALCGKNLIRILPYIKPHFTFGKSNILDLCDSNLIKAKVITSEIIFNLETNVYIMGVYNCGELIGFFRFKIAEDENTQEVYIHIPEIIPLDNSLDNKDLIHAVIKYIEKIGFDYHIGLISIEQLPNSWESHFTLNELGYDFDKSYGIDPNQTLIMSKRVNIEEYSRQRSDSSK